MLSVPGGALLLAVPQPCSVPCLRVTTILLKIRPFLYVASFHFVDFDP